MDPAHQIDWPQLPKEVLYTILQHVELQDRYRACALVNKAWKETAEAVPVTTLSTQRTSAAALKSAWQAEARRFGSQLTHLTLCMGRSGLDGACHTDISADQYPILQLPCPGLHKLGLQNLAVNLAQGAADPADGNPVATLSPLSTVTGLTKLRMRDVVLLGQPQQRLAAMAALTGLQHLRVQDAQHAAVLAGAGHAVPGDNGSPLLPDGLLPQLHHLTYLHASNHVVQLAISAAGMKDITHLTGLQHLVVSLRSDDAQAFDVPAGISALTQLTYLSLYPVEGLPDLAALTPMRHLTLHLRGNLHATALTGLTGLRTVNLTCDDFDDPAALLTWLQHQSSMTYLYLSRADDSPDIPNLSDALQAAFTGPLVGNKLQRLTLDNMLPPSAWQHIFPAGQQCLALMSLNIFSRHGPASNEPWTRLVAACPRLNELWLCGLTETQHITDMTPPAAEMQPLTALITLVLSGLQEQHVPHLARLPRLSFLELHQTSITDACRAQLTSMQTLQSLMVYGENHHNLVCWSKHGGFQQF